MKKLFLVVLLFGVLIACSSSHEGVVSEEQIPKFTNKVNMKLNDGKIEFLGWYTDPLKPRHGESFKLVTYWRFNEQLEKGWKLFFHFEDKEGNERFIYDHKFLEGKVEKLATGKIIMDTAQIKEIPKFFDTDTMYIRGGFFNGGKRTTPEKQYNDGKNRLEMGSIKITKPNILKKKMDVFTIAGNSRDQLKIDGVLKESFWANASKDDKFWISNGSGLSKAKTTVMTAMDHKNLYFAFDVEDEDIYAELKKDDEPIYDKDDVVEVFIDPRGEGKIYYEIQVSAGGVKFDSKFNGRRKNRDDSYDSKIKYAVKLNGKLNDSKEKDKGWTVEMAIPWSSIEDAPVNPPKDGDKWKAFIYRIDRHTGKKSTSEDFTAWTPPYAGDFHNLKFMGELIFVYEEIL